MIRRPVLFGFLMQAAVAPLTLCAQRPALPPSTISSIDSAVGRFMATNHVPGVSVAVVEGAAYAWSEGFGMADMENFVPATPQTLFRLASVSKPLTATAALELWEAGKLDLNAPVQRYCAAFPTKPWPVTTREVLGHLGGIRHYRSDSDTDPEVSNTRHFTDPIAGGLSFFATDTLVAKPMSRFHYSTQGYTVVGCVIQGAAGEAYADYMRQHVFGPAGMAHTVVDDRYAIVPLRTRFYHRDNTGHVVNADLLDNSYKLPGGGWLSSAEDLAHFEVALLDDGLLRPATRTIAWTAQHTSSGATTAYGLGWGVDTAASAHDVGHSGGQQGTSTAIILDPGPKLGVVVLTNMDDVDAYGLAEVVLKIVRGSRQAAER